MICTWIFIYFQKIKINELTAAVERSDAPENKTLLEKILVEIQSKNLYEKNDLQDWANQKPSVNYNLKENTKSAKQEKVAVQDKNITSKNEESIKKNRFAKKKLAATKESVSNKDL